MAPAKGKKRYHSPSISIDDYGLEDDASVAAPRPRAGKKAARTDNWDSWQESVQTQEAERVKQYMSTFQGNVTAVRKKAVEKLRKAEQGQSKAESFFLTAIKEAVGQEHASAEAGTDHRPLRAASEELLQLFHGIVKRYEQTNEELQSPCGCFQDAGTGAEDSRLLPQAAWDKDHEEARKLLEYGRAYGDSLVHEIIVPKSAAQASASMIDTDNLGLDRTGKSAIALFPRSRATVVGGQTWGEAARMQMQALTGLIQTLPGCEKEAAGGKTVTFDC